MHERFSFQQVFFTLESSNLNTNRFENYSWTYVKLFRKSIWRASGVVRMFRIFRSERYNDSASHARTRPFFAPIVHRVKRVTSADYRTRANYYYYLLPTCWVNSRPDVYALPPPRSLLATEDFAPDTMMYYKRVHYLVRPSYYAHGDACRTVSFADFLAN